MTGAPGCAAASLDAGVFREEVVVTRSIAIVGAGVEQTWIACDDGPCLTVLPGVELALSAVTVASYGTAISAWFSTLSLSEMAVQPLAGAGGWIKVHDTESRLVAVDIDVAQRTQPPVQAVSRRGSDLSLEGVRFFGAEPASGTESGVYSVGYGVSCTGCSFHPGRSRRLPPEPLLELGDPSPSAGEIEGKLARWPQLHCPAADGPAREVCASQCAPEEEVALCRMAWEAATEACRPQAVCVPSDEAVPDHVPE